MRSSLAFGSLALVACSSTTVVQGRSDAAAGATGTGGSAGSAGGGASGGSGGTSGSGGSSGASGTGGSSGTGGTAGSGGASGSSGSAGTDAGAGSGGGAGADASAGASGVAGSGGSNPCAGITCTSPPADTCTDATHALVHDAPGTCSDGGCDYTTHGVTCTDQACVSGACVGACSPSAKQCTGQQPQQCDSNGAWQNNGSVCANQACVNGACQGVCSPSAKRCSGNGVQTCSSSGQWGSPVACSSATPQCTGAGICGAPSSCQGLANTCGPASNESCCTSPLVTGGTFKRSYDNVTYTNGSYPATVSDFRLDKYEITVGRFRKFVAAWDGGWRPAQGAGKHTHLNGGSGLVDSSTGTTYEPGWSTSWATNLATTNATWSDTSHLSCDSTYQTWTSSAGANERRPVNCMDWYDAAAFCIWDGGFLPSEAERNYAAAGGSEQRVYPWSSPANSTLLDCAHANYGGANWPTTACVVSGTNDVGAEAPLGDGKWGQSESGGERLGVDLGPVRDALRGFMCRLCLFGFGPSQVASRRGLQRRSVVRALLVPRLPHPDRSRQVLRGTVREDSLAERRRGAPNPWRAGPDGPG